MVNGNGALHVNKHIQHIHYYYTKLLVNLPWRNGERKRIHFRVAQQQMHAVLHIFYFFNFQDEKKLAEFP